MSLMTPEEVIGVRRLGAVASNMATYESKNARVDMGEGLIVIQDAASEFDCDLPASGAELVANLGMTVYRPAKEEGLNAFYDAGEQVSILRQGKGYASCATAAVAGAQVFVVHTGGGEGTVRNDADGGNATAAPGLRFDENASAGPVRIRLNLPSA